MPLTRRLAAGTHILTRSIVVVTLLVLGGTLAGCTTPGEQSAGYVLQGDV